MEIDTFFEKVLTIFDKYKVSFILGVVGLTLIGVGFLIPKLNLQRKEVKLESTETQKPNLIKVDVAGAVKEPGVHQLAEGERVLDAIYKAGGFSIEVDTNAVATELNLAAKLVDGQKIYIKKVGEADSNLAQTQVQSTNNLININTATSSQLDTLPGIGEVTANKIISNRPYQKKEDLLTKKAVGKATFDKIKDLISVF